MEDPVVGEIRKVRDEHAARFNYDLRAIFEDLKKREGDGGVRMVSMEPKRIPKAGKVAEQGH